MSDTRNWILTAVLEAVDEVNEHLPLDRRVPRHASAPLGGAEGHLDSLGLVNLILAVERRIPDALGVPVILTDDLNLFEPDGPCTSVQRLSDHIATMVARASRG